MTDDNVIIRYEKGEIVGISAYSGCLIFYWR